MSIKKKARRIDLDTEEHIYHLKVKLPFNSFSANIWGNHLPISVVNRRLVSPLPTPLVYCFRWNPRTGLMHGSPNCAIIDCIGRMKLWGHHEMLVFTYFLQPPQLNPHQLLMFLLWMERYVFVIWKSAQQFLGKLCKHVNCVSFYKPEREGLLCKLTLRRQSWYLPSKLITSID